MCAFWEGAFFFSFLICCFLLFLLLRFCLPLWVIATLGVGLGSRADSPDLELSGSGLKVKCLIVASFRNFMLRPPGSFCLYPQAGVGYISMPHR